MVENQNNSDRDTNAGEKKPVVNLLPIYEMRAEEIEKALLTGEHADLLKVYFSNEYARKWAYDELREASLKAAATTQDGPRVLILPGITGSQLGTKPDDIVWLNPKAIMQGRIIDVSLDGGTKQNVLGVAPEYILIKASLRAEGFNADFYAYDWRLGIDVRFLIP